MKRQNARWRGLSIDTDTTVGASPRLRRPSQAQCPGPMPDCRGCDMVQFETRVAASARYLVRIIVYFPIVSEMLKQFLCFVFHFASVGMSATRMVRVRSIAMRLRAGWCGPARSSGRLNSLVELVLVGTPRVPPGHCGRSLLIRSSAGFYDEHSYCDYALGRCCISTYQYPPFPPPLLLRSH